MTRKDIAFQLLLKLEEEPSYRWSPEQDKELARALSLNLWHDKLEQAMQQARPGVSFDNCRERFIVLRRSFGLPEVSRAELKARPNPAPKYVRDYQGEVLRFLFSRADANGIVQASQTEITEGLDCNRSSVQRALGDLLQSEQIVLLKRPHANEPAVFLVKEAACVASAGSSGQLSIGPIGPVSKICPKNDANRIAELAKETGAIQLSVKDGVLIASIAGNPPPKAEFVGVYDEHTKTDYLEEDLADLLEKHR